MKVGLNKEEEGPTLRELSSLLCKRIDIGTTILPKPLFVNEAKNGVKIDNATVDVASSDGDPSSQHSLSNCVDEEATQYANVVQSEFNAIVIEVRFINIIRHLFCVVTSQNL